jgi:hypothetical protein
MNQLRRTHFPLLAHKFAHPENANILGCSAKSNQKIAPKKKGQFGVILRSTKNQRVGEWRILFHGSLNSVDG